MPTNCTITFDHSNEIYYSGETLNGTIQLHTTKTKSIRGILIKVKGTGEVRWTEQRTQVIDGKTESYDEHYYTNEQYLNSLTYLHGSSDSKSFDLPAGMHNYTFSCGLPLSLPTTCKEKYGEIRYRVTVVIERSMAFNHEYKRPFIVKHYLDLNSNRIYKIPKTCEGESATCCLLCCCCFRNGEGLVKAELATAYSGYAAGHWIPFKLTISNDSNSDVDGAKVKLEKCKTFESTSPSRSYRYITTELGRKTFNSVLRLSRKEYSGQMLIPYQSECTQNGNCITLDYVLKAKIIMDGCCSSNIKLKMPIIVGTVPITENSTEIPFEIISVQPKPTAPKSSSNANNINSSAVFQSLDLPSYEATINSSEQTSETKNYPIETYTGSPTAPDDDRASYDETETPTKTSITLNEVDSENNHKKF